MAPGPVARVLEMAAGRPPTLGAGRLVCIDGPAGSGKTTLARDLAAATGGCVVHMDDLYEGWSGIDSVEDQLATLLGPLAAGRAGAYRRYDWHVGAYAEAVSVAPTDLLVLEGVGSAAAAHAALITVTVWVEAPRAVRLQRGLDRDGADQRDHWRAWQRAEDAHFAREQTHVRADLAVDGWGALAGPGDGGDQFRATFAAQG